MPERPGDGKFKVTINDDDFSVLGNETGMQWDFPTEQVSTPERFEVNFSDDDMSLVQDTSQQAKYNGEIYFSAVKPQKKQPQVEPKKQVATASNAKKSAATKSKNKSKKKKPKNVFGLFLVILLVFTIGITSYGMSCVNDVLGFNRSEDLVTVNIPVDATTDDIIDILKDEGLIKQKYFCTLYYKAFDFLKNYNKTNVKSPVYNSGIYEVEKNLGFEGYLTKFKEVQTSNETVTAVFPEGWSISQIIDRADKYDICSKSKLLSSIRNGTYDYSFLSEITNKEERAFTLEGYLYPDTYEFYANTDANSIIRKMLERGDEMWTEEYQTRAEELGYTRDGILTIASIIQREAANKSQMADISSVIHNRLNHPASWPTLGCDSTLKYVQNYVTPILTPEEGAKYEKLYSTSLNRGLPPGPICNPGDDAINAALYPNDTSYYFFRHDKNGEIYLASTQSQHDANANKVLKANNQ